MKKNTVAPIAKTNYRVLSVAKVKKLKTAIDKLPDQLNEMKQTVKSDEKEINTALKKISNELDSMSELGEMESLRLQMAMVRLSKMMSALSNILKNLSDTQQSIFRNMK